VLIQHGNLLVALVMEGIFIENAVEGPDVIVVGITHWKLAASDIDIVNLFFVSSI
jgi:hypothetical protein